jgi:hypothetical protein
MLLSYLVATAAFTRGMAIGGAVTWMLMRKCRQRRA